MPVVHALVGEVRLFDGVVRQSTISSGADGAWPEHLNRQAYLRTIPASREIKVSSAHQLNRHFLRTTSAKH
jgi:hypothetical protein